MTCEDKDPAAGHPDLLLSRTRLEQVVRHLDDVRDDTGSHQILLALGDAADLLSFLDEIYGEDK